MDGNSAYMVGNLTADPELKFVGQDNIPVCNFTIARSWKVGPADNQSERTNFQKVVVWRELAEHLVASCRKGDRVSVTGSNETRSYKAEDGTNRYVTEIKASEIAVSLRFAIATITPTAGRHAGEVREMAALVPSGAGAEDPAEDIELGEEPY